MSKGVKHDQNKRKLHMIPTEALNQEAQAFEIGAVKYGKWNFTRGLEVSRYLDSAMRHILAFKDGETMNVEEISLPEGRHTVMVCTHLGAARACLAMLIQNLESGKAIDDRCTDG